ncbi:hypothetical protein IMCC3135_28600 [Granulosicoccus antarcticus IMCC3135]|uniref:site-specific DNA-methyltransferase (adenine-specific) n=2 Tax=Granulosicoccus TaxID=437504 RepID=A0A2Z2NWH3_9GAMM|nr:hypothetical protein IMCC3135_28600 [Granulosicoccus antarcticus IMCC3135]
MTGKPTDMFYNTGIATYVWVLSNKKREEQKGQVLLINGVNLYGKMRKSLGSKRNEMSEKDVATIVRCFGNYEAVERQALDKPAEQKSNRGRQSANAKEAVAKTFAAKLFASHEFGYRRLTIERPLRQSWQFSDELLSELRFSSSRAINTAMKWVYAEYGETYWSDEEDCEQYGQLIDYETEIRVHIKANLSAMKEKDIKDLLNEKTWLNQKALLLKARALQGEIGNEQHDDVNPLDCVLKTACKTLDIKLETAEKKQLLSAICWTNPEAEKVVKKVHKAEADPVYGLFETTDAKGKAQVVEYTPDSDLRDNENVPLDPSRSVNEVNEAYFAKEVQPHVPDAWIDASKRDDKDGDIGIVGYEIPFNRHFYEYVPPRDLSVIDAELAEVSREIMGLLGEVGV